MRQRTARSSTPAHGPLIRALLERPDGVIDVVAADVARPGEDRGEVRARVTPVVRRLLAALADGDPVPSEGRRLHDEGAAAARAGEGVAVPIDRYLSAGWAIWDAAAHHPAADVAALAALGSALLRAGDQAAAAIAEGHGEAEREIAGRTAAARRAFVDDLLDLDPADVRGLARLRPRADALGIRLAPTYRPVVAWLGRELDDETVDLGALLRAGLAPRRAARAPRVGDLPADPLAVTRAGRLVLVVPTDRFDREALGVALAGEVGGGDGWVAVVGPPADIGWLGAGVAGVLRALALAERAGHRGALVDGDVVALEAALLADPASLERAVRRELGPIIAAPRNAAALLLTLRTWLEEGQNVRATARALGVAPRTVAYRMERIGWLLGARLEGPRTLRLAAALIGQDLLAIQAAEAEPAG